MGNSFEVGSWQAGGMRLGPSEDEQERWKAHGEEPVPLSNLPSRRSKANKEEVAKTTGALDHNLLAVLPSHIINQLKSRQEDWLVARLMCGSDKQACYHLGMGVALLNSWKQKDYFATAYELVTLDRLNTTLVLNRVLMLRVAIKQSQLLDHPSIAVQMQVMEQLVKQAVSMSKVPEKTNNTQVNIYGNESIMEWARKRIVGQIVDGEATELDEGGSRGSNSASPGVSGGSLELSPVHEDSGRERLSDSALRVVGLADTVAEEVQQPSEVHHHPERETAWSVMADRIVGLMDGDI